MEREKRKFQRLQGSVDLFYTVLNGIPKQRKPEITDVSREGLKLCGYNHLKIGDILELKIMVPGIDRPIVAFAEKIWAAKREDEKYNTGMRFTRISDLDRSMLIDYVYQQHTHE